MERQIKREPPSTCCESAASTPSPPAQHTEDAATASPSASPKRQAGRTKFRETRHPVYRGRAGGVCEVRVPGRRGCRLWLGTFAAAEDAAMLALRPATAVATRCLNFADSAWLLDVPVPVPPNSTDVRRAVALAVEGFLRARAIAEDAMSSTSEPSLAANDEDAATETEASSSSSGSDDDAREASPFELDMLSDMGAGLYYAGLAQGLLMEPPPLDAPCADDGSYFDDLAGVALWSY